MSTRNKKVLQVLLLLVATLIPAVQALGKCEGLPKACAEVESTQECSELWQCINIGGGVCGSLNLNGVSARSCEWFDGNEDLCEMHGCSYNKQLGFIVGIWVLALFVVVALTVAVVICHRQCRRRCHGSTIEPLEYCEVPAYNPDLMEKAEPVGDMETYAAPVDSAKLRAATTI